MYIHFSRKSEQHALHQEVTKTAFICKCFSLYGGRIAPGKKVRGNTVHKSETKCYLMAEVLRSHQKA